uniref:Uncharacterized protein n=1 Tax=Panagrolaimus sp. ES5 TaxID=591445 RepID=A0AC34GHR3_9BILA
MNDSSTSCYEPIPKKPRFTNGYSQRSPNILELQKEQYNYRGSNDEAEETITALAESQEELRSRNEDLEKTLAEVQSTSENQINHLKTESEAKDKQIQTLEQQLLSVMNTNKSNSDREKEIKVLQDRITEWQSTCDK